jgi:hypothetical protein
LDGNSLSSRGLWNHEMRVPYTQVVFIYLHLLDVDYNFKFVTVDSHKIDYYILEDLKEQKQIHMSIHIEWIIAFWGTSWHDEYCQTHVIFGIIVYAFLITFIFPLLGFNIMIKLVAKFVKTHHMSCMILSSCFALQLVW